MLNIGHLLLGLSPSYSITRQGWGCHCLAFSFPEPVFGGCCVPYCGVVKRTQEFQTAEKWTGNGHFNPCSLSILVETHSRCCKCTITRHQAQGRGSRNYSSEDRETTSHCNDFRSRYVGRQSEGGRQISWSLRQQGVIDPE